MSLVPNANLTNCTRPVAKIDKVSSSAMPMENMVIGIAAAAGLLLIIAILLVYFFVIRRRRGSRLAEYINYDEVTFENPTPSRKSKVVPLLEISAPLPGSGKVTSSSMMSYKANPKRF
jgi:hypothetical protein